MSKMEYMPVDCLQVPKVLFQIEKYKNLSNTAKILYSLFLDRLKFAVQNGWVDHNGDLFVIYPKSEMKKDLNTTRYGVDQAVQELVKAGKLMRIIPNNGKANHFYISDIYENEKEEKSMMTLDTIMANMPLVEREIIMDKMVKASRDILETIADMGYIDEYETSLTAMEERGYQDELGEMDIDQIQADGYEFGILGKKAHTPRKKTVTQAEPPKVNLLVDIQAKLQAGKGAGYARWAKVFNLKQMAQTMNYLSENNLLEYAVLEEKAAAATAHHNELSAHIKAAEKRMAEIAVLRTHIVNYAKTREVYVAYRKAGYSKKFREAHEEEILLHQAAKNAFDEMGVKKLPKVKELQTEYAKLLEEKKKTYSEYRRSREEMRELLTAKANVDRVLKMEVEQDVEKEKDHGQR